MPKGKLNILVIRGDDIGIGNPRQKAAGFTIEQILARMESSIAGY